MVTFDPFPPVRFLFRKIWAEDKLLKFFIFQRQIEIQLQRNTKNTNLAIKNIEANALWMFPTWSNNLQRSTLYESEISDILEILK